ncbi:MAG: 4-hydroxythreonine-4-phosphate dehydrogenase PdxA [Verrucomicrobiota bacterium]|nr:4-hydroxythreonine-4-phosphate dehydrogenase PdxA [Limisphaera sp.]MDW8381222.1 4-hydroxythreonine-4-phosphate dehydrogenase PdxA [Verrucomicrobiota bacterium]
MNVLSDHACKNQPTPAPVRIGITFGDVTGVGPEVIVKALAQIFAGCVTPVRDAPVEFVLYGDRGWWERVVQQLTSLRALHSEMAASLLLDRLAWADSIVGPLPQRLAPGDAQAAQAAVRWLEAAARDCLKGDLDAMVTGPVHKAAIQRAGIRFVGQTEFLGALAGEPEPVMMLLGTDPAGRWLRVALVTVHVALREVPSRLSVQRIVRTIECAREACERLRLPRTKVAVCGLNPHCGEDGAFGDEEKRLIQPALERAREQGWQVEGPCSGDTVFHHALQGRFDAVVAMYHDQGLAPLKAVAFDTGVNWSLGLPFIRTSPDHGTAYDIAGRGMADATSMRCALELACQLAVQARQSAASAAHMYRD